MKTTSLHKCEGFSFYFIYPRVLGYWYTSRLQEVSMCHRDKMFANWSIITLMQKVGSWIQNRKGQAGLDLELDHLWNNQINVPAAKSGT